MQKCELRRNFDPIAFQLFRIKGTKLNYSTETKYLQLVGSSGYCKSKFEVTKIFSLSKGAYLVKPERTGRKNKEFIIRVYTESSLNKKYLLKNQLKKYITN